ncbi:sulfotransferase family 2 domain-containing protein [Paraburkholderia phymatum]|uniref:sulfotransferase family 2 domain-containing protein n=1 Tax=Paraburkholderia phymatum TaxID=148447 RepID=UPI003179A4F5
MPTPVCATELKPSSFEDYRILTDFAILTFSGWANAAVQKFASTLRTLLIFLNMLDNTIGKIAFLHIPKTAGVSVIDAFVQRLGAESCQAFSSEISEDVFSKKTFVSGHVYLGDIQCDPFIFTFVRNPLEQIASHLMWVDHYNQPEYEIELNGFPEKIRQEIRRVASVDLSSAKSIDKYFESRSHDSEIRLINLQSELLVFKRGHVTEMTHRDLASKAINNLNRFGFVGISEDLSAEMKTLFEMLNLGASPVISHLNSSPSSRKVDTSVHDIQRTLLKYVQADLRLYEHVMAEKKSSLKTNRNIFSIMQSFARKYTRA